MILPDHEIRSAIADGRLGFTPTLLDEQIGPASIDLRLSNTFRVFRPGRITVIDPRSGIPPEYLETLTLDADTPFVLHAGEFVLAATVEYVKIPDDLAGRVEGKSTLARFGILVHSAGYVDPGYEGVLTLEISNRLEIAVQLYPGMYICQIAIEKLSSAAACPYHARPRALYLGDRGPTEARTANLFPRT